MVHGFSLALIIGILIGTYSSIYIAGSVAISLGMCRKSLLPRAKTLADEISDLARPNLYENPEAGKVSDKDGSVIHPDGQHFLNTLFFQRLMSIELIGKRGDRGPYGILIKVADHEASQILECHEASVLLRDQRP